MTITSTDPTTFKLSMRNGCGVLFRNHAKWNRRESDYCERSVRQQSQREFLCVRNRGGFGELHRGMRCVRLRTKSVTVNPSGFVIAGPGGLGTPVQAGIGAGTASSLTSLWWS